MAWKAVLFDMDGVLIDSEEYMAKTGVRALKKYGINAKESDFAEFVGCGENRYVGGVAEKYGVPQDWVVIGSGSSELLGLAAETVLSEGTTAIYPQYSFSLYPMVARLCGAETIEIPSTGDFNADLDAMADAVDERTRLIFLTNPNNPTGTYLAEKDILDFLDKIPPTVMVLLLPTVSVWSWPMVLDRSWPIFWFWSFRIITR